MPDRRNSRKYNEPGEGMESKFYFYIFTLGSVALLAGVLWLFGIDFGFFQFGGVVTVGWALWIFLGALIVEYFVDVRYAINLYKRFKVKSVYALIPLVNSIKVWDKFSKALSAACIVLIALASALIFTPVMTYVAPAWIMETSMWASVAIIISVLALFIIRGVQMAKLKIELINRYTKLVGMGAVPAMGIFKSILYFMPVVRIALLIEDMTFINNVFSAIEKNKRVERGDL